MTNYDLNNFYEWPLLIRYLIMGLVFVLVLYAGYHFDINSLSLRAASIKQQEASMKEQIQIIANKQNALTTELLQRPKLQRLLTKAQQSFVLQKNIPELLNQILKVGTSAQLQFNTFTPGVETSHDGYNVLPIKAVVAGSFIQIVNFMAAIADMNTIVLINDFTINKPSNDAAAPNPAAGAPGSITATIVLEIYRLDKA